MLGCHQRVARHSWPSEELEDYEGLNEHMGNSNTNNYNHNHVRLLIVNKLVKILITVIAFLQEPCICIRKGVVPHIVLITQAAIQGFGMEKVSLPQSDGERKRQQRHCQCGASWDGADGPTSCDFGRASHAVTILAGPARGALADTAVHHV